MAERFHDIDEFGVFALDAALLARLHIGRERLAALFDHGGEVFRELLDIEGLALNRVRWSSHLKRLVYFVSVRISGFTLHVYLHMGLHCSRARRVPRELFSPR